MRSVFIIAEAGVNHNGSIDQAKKLVDVAADAGVNAVKFQTFKADNIVTLTAGMAEYQQKNLNMSDSQYNMLRQLELSFDEFVVLKKYCSNVDVEFMTTPFDIESLKFIVEDLGVSKIKISSGDITNGPLLFEAAKFKLPIILSTGMSTLAEIEQALSVIAYGLIGGDSPSIEEFDKAYFSEEGKLAISKYVTVLHCTSSYPAPYHDVNLNCINTLRQAFGLDVGYSDHTIGEVVPIAAVAKGASMIEKHFTISRALKGPDHVVSLEPEELISMVKSIRVVESVFGSSEKRPTVSELATRTAARKSLVANNHIVKGQAMQSLLSIKRPGNGLSPMRFWEIGRQTSIRDYEVGDLIQV